jgi:hypothetical protein
MNKIENISEEEVTLRLTYAGFILIAFELIKSLIVKPIKFFYKDTTFIGSSLFHSYEVDVMSRNKNEFEACLLYLRDFMKAIDSEDLLTIQELRKHRNNLAHNLVNELPSLNIEKYLPLLERVDKALFNLSKHQTFIEIGADPEFGDIDWSTLKGHEYLFFEEILKKINNLLKKDDKK